MHLILIPFLCLTLAYSQIFCIIQQHTWFDNSLICYRRQGPLNKHLRGSGLQSYDFWHFYVFPTLWRKNAFLRLKWHPCFFAKNAGITGFPRFQNLLSTLKIHFSTWLKSCRLETRKPPICRRFGRLNNACLHFFYGLIFLSIGLEIQVESRTGGS